MDETLVDSSELVNRNLKDLNIATNTGGVVMGQSINSNLNNATNTGGVAIGLSIDSNLNNDTNAAKVAMGSSVNSNLINANGAYQQNMRHGFNMQPGSAYQQNMRNVINVQPKGTTGVVANKTNFCKNNNEFLSFSVNNDIDVLQRYGILNMLQPHNGTYVATDSNGPSMPQTHNRTYVAIDSNGPSVLQTQNRTNIATDSNGPSVPQTQNGANVGTDSNGPSVPQTQNRTNVGTDSNGTSMPQTQNGTNDTSRFNPNDSQNNAIPDGSNRQQSAYYPKYYPHPITGRLITSGEMTMFEKELDYIKNNYGTVPSMQWFDKWKMSSSKETFDRLGIDTNIDLESKKLLGWKTKSCPNTSRAHFETLPYCGPYHDKEGNVKYVDYRPKNNVSVNSNTGGLGFPFPVIQDGGGVFQFGLGNFGGTMMTC